MSVRCTGGFYLELDSPLLTQSGGGAAATLLELHPHPYLCKHPSQVDRNGSYDANICYKLMFHLRLKFPALKSTT